MVAYQSRCSRALQTEGSATVRLGVRDFEIRWISRGFRISDCISVFHMDFWISGFQSRPVARIFEGGLRRCLMCMYAYINKQAGKTRGVWGDAPPGNFKKLDALRLLLGPLVAYFIQSHMHLLNQLTSNFHERRY